jgi:hypothetical protein
MGGLMSPRTGLDGLDRRKISPVPGLELWPLYRPARSQSLYRLRYPSSQWKQKSCYYFGKLIWRISYLRPSKLPCGLRLSLSSIALISDSWVRIPLRIQICLLFLCLCCLASVETLLRCIDPPSIEFYQMSIKIWKPGIHNTRRV